MVGREQGRIRWREKKETRLRKSEKGVELVLKAIKTKQKKMRKIVVSQFIQIRKCFKASNQRLLVRERADRKGTHAYFMPSQGNLLLYGKYCTSAACVYACACQTEN